MPLGRAISPSSAAPHAPPALPGGTFFDATGLLGTQHRGMVGRGAATRYGVKQKPKRVFAEAKGEGVFQGRITGLNGRMMEVTLEDGRVINAKPAGKLSYGKVSLRIGHAVAVKYSTDMDEDDQVHMLFLLPSFPPSLLPSLYPSIPPPLLLLPSPHAQAG